MFEAMPSDWKESNDNNQMKREAISINFNYSRFNHIRGVLHNYETLVLILKGFLGYLALHCSHSRSQPGRKYGLP